MTSFHWTPTRLDQLEHAARDGRRIILNRRGTEYIVVARRLTMVGRSDAVIGWLPMTGEEVAFRLDEIDAFQVID